MVSSDIGVVEEISTPDPNRQQQSLPTTFKKFRGPKRFQNYGRQQKPREQQHYYYLD